MTPAIGRAPYLGEYPLFARCCNASSDKFNWIFSVSSVVLAIFQMEVEYLFGNIFIYWRKRNHFGETSQNSGRKYCAITSMSFPESGICPDCICSTTHWLPILEVKMIMEFEKSPSRPSLSCILPSSIIAGKHHKRCCGLSQSHRITLPNKVSV